MSSFEPEHIISDFKVSGLYPVSKAAIANKNVSVSAIESQSKATPPNNKQPELSTENMNVSDKPTSNDSLLNLPGPSLTSTSRPMPIEIPKPSLMKKLREAIINTLSSEQSTDVKVALKNSKTK